MHAEETYEGNLMNGYSGEGTYWTNNYIYEAKKYN